MYYPKSQIKTNLYTQGGEFVFFETDQEYKGPYYILSKGRIYSGKSPNDPNSKLLQPFSKSPQFLSNPSDPEGGEIGSLNDASSFYSLPLNYVIASGISVSSAPQSPKYSYPTITEKDYELGEFQRYFLKKNNEPKFIEVSLENYRKYISKDKTTLHTLYTPFQINWILTGDKEQIYNINKSIVSKIEREKNFMGFTNYFRDNFTQFHK